MRIGRNADGDLCIHLSGVGGAPAGFFASLDASGLGACCFKEGSLPSTVCLFPIVLDMFLWFTPGLLGKIHLPREVKGYCEKYDRAKLYRPTEVSLSLVGFNSSQNVLIHDNSGFHSLTPVGGGG